MAEHHQQHPMGSIKSMLPDKGPSTSQIVAVVSLVPIGGILLTIAGLILTATIIGLALATPVFVIFSPVLVPAAITIGLAVTGFLASGAFGLTALSSLSWIIQAIRSTSLQAAKRVGETAGQVGQRTKDMGQSIQQKAQETTRT